MANAMEKHLNRLVGQKIKRVVKDSSDEEAVYGLEFETGMIAWILQDPEGNGPGFLDIEIS